MSNFNLNIYTPNGIVVKQLACQELLIPTIGGEINVLPGHTHVLAQLEAGILTAKTGSSDRHFTMTGGLCKVLGKEVTILSTTSETAEKIDVERAKAAKSKAESRLAGNEILTDAQLIKFQRKLERAKARIQLGNLRQR